MKAAMLTAALLVACWPMSPAMAQHHHGAHDTEATEPAKEDHSAHLPPATPAEEAHQHHPAEVPQQAAPPALPTDHAADAFYDPATMARARAAMVRENGGMTFSQVMIDRLEYRAGRGGDGYLWEGEAWVGGDINRFTVKTEGEGETGGRLDGAEVQALYSRAIDPWFNLEAGIRQDIGTGPNRSYAAIGIDGLAPYWFEVSAQAFLSTQGDAHLRLEASYDQRITQRLILQPALEVNISAQDVPQLGLGSGLTDVELGLRLRYEIAREFAPYLGVNWERKIGDTADFSGASGDRPSLTSFVLGVRLWF